MHPYSTCNSVILRIFIVFVWSLLLHQGRAQSFIWDHAISIPKEIVVESIAMDSRNSLYMCDKKSKEIFVVDSSGKLIRKFKPRMSISTGSYVLEDPRCIAIDHQDRLFIYDGSEKRIIRCNSSGDGDLIFGEKGSDIGQIDDVQGLAVDSRGYIYALNGGRKEIDVFTPEGVFLTYIVGGMGSFSDPYKITVSGSDELYVLDEEGPAVFAFDIHGNQVNGSRHLAKKPGISVSKPLGFTALVNGDFILFDKSSTILTQFDRLGNVQSTGGSKGPAGNGVFTSAGEICAGKTPGNVIAVCDPEASRVQYFTVVMKVPAIIQEEKRMQLFEERTSSLAHYDLVCAPNGMRYVIPYKNRETVVAYKDTTRVEAFSMSGHFMKAACIATDNKNNVIVGDIDGQQVVVFDGKGNLVRKFGKDIPKKLRKPTSIATQQNGDIIVLDTDNGNLHLWSSDGVYQRLLIPAGAPGVKTPVKIQTDSKDQIYIWDEGGNCILRVGSNGWPLAPRKLQPRSEKAGGRPGEIGGFYVDPMDQIHIFNKTTNQLEVYGWEVDPILKFSCGHPGKNNLGFTDIENILFDKGAFIIHFNYEEGKGEKICQFQVKPPKPGDQMIFEVENEKLHLSFTPIPVRSVIGYGLVTTGANGADTLVTKSTQPMLEVPGDPSLNPHLRSFRLVSLSYTDISEPNKGFDDYLDYATKLQSVERYDEAMTAWQAVLENMGGQPSLTTYVADQTARTGRKLAKTGDIPKAIQYLKMAYGLHPANQEIQLAYAAVLTAFFQQLANRDDHDGIVLEAERLIQQPQMRNIVIQAVDSVSYILCRLPSESSIKKAISLQKRLIEWDKQNPRYLGSLAVSNYNLYQFRKISGVPGAELQTLLTESEKYGRQAISAMKRLRIPYYDLNIIYLKTLNLEEKYSNVETLVLGELAETSFSLNAGQVEEYRKILAESYIGQNKYESAVLEYQRILAVDPDNNEVKGAMAAALVKSGKLDDARQLYQQVILAEKDNAKYIAEIGKIELLKKNYIEASFQLEKAIHRDESDRSFYGPLGEAFEGATNFQRALDCYKIAIQYTGNKLQLAKNTFASDREVKELQDALYKYRSHTAMINEEIGNHEAAVEAWVGVVKDNPAIAEAQYGLGKASLNAGFVYDAVNALYAACKLDPNNELYSNAHANALKMREKYSKNESPLSISDLAISEIYPSLFRNYADVKMLPVGEVIISNNTSGPITPQSVSLYIKEVMDEPTQNKVPALVGYSNTAVKLSVLFNEKILSYTEDQKLQAEVVISYNNGGESKTARQAVTVTLHGRNAITWTDKRRLAAFVSPNVEALVNYDKKIDQYFREQPLYGLNKSLLRAMQIYTVLNESPMTYTPDPVQSFASASTNTDILDKLQYPTETLLSKTGDCDDLVAVYDGLLENAGIPSAYIDLPGHVMSAFDVQIKPSEMGDAGLNPLDVIVQNGKVWIPIETTMLGKNDFLQAWKSAAQRYYDELQAGRFPELVSLADARSVYAPSSYIPAGFAAEPTLTVPVLEEYTRLQGELLNRTKKELVAELEIRYLNEPDNAYIKNRFATVLSQVGDLKRAEQIMYEAIDLSPDSPSILNNMGNVQFLMGNAMKAIQYYTEASSKDPSDGEIYINICKAHMLAGHVEEAKKCFTKAIELNPDLEYLYSDLKSQLR